MAHPLIGQTLAHYQITGALGAGAMSEVYRAVDSRLHKEVAIKVILEKIAQRPDLVERFEREARAAARLEHGNVASVYFFGTHDARPFYAMELIRGHSLEAICENHPRCTIDQLLSLFAQCAAGLQAALDGGVLHRDIKPANLMLTMDGAVKIVDFGLARLNDEKGMTRSGTVIGTPFYMAPEVVAGKVADHRADVYSLGVTFYHLFGGAPPFDAETPYGVMMQHIQAPVPDLRRIAPLCPQELATLVGDMMAKDPAARPQGYDEVHTRIREIAARVGRTALDPPMLWCGSERALTRPDPSGRCSSCRRVYGVGERPERYHVTIAAWRENDGAERVASWISRAVNQPVEEIRDLIGTLPYRVANRVQRERARKIQRQLYDLGAEVELLPVSPSEGEGEGAALRELSWKPLWPPPPRGGSVIDLPPRQATRGGLPPARSPRPRLSAAWILSTVLGVLVIALAGVLLSGREPAPPIPEATPGAGRSAGPPRSPLTGQSPTEERDPIEVFGEEGTQGTPEAVAERADDGPELDSVSESPRGAAAAQEPAPGEPTPSAGQLSSRWFRVDLAGDLEVEDARRTLAALEAGAERVQATLGGLERRPLPLRLTTQDASDRRGWARAAHYPNLGAPARGGGPRGAQR